MTAPAPEVRLRRTGVRDLDRVLEIEAGPDTAGWLGETSRGWHAGALTDPDREHLLVLHEECTAGFVVLAAPRGTEQGVELRRIVIAPELRGRGLGRAALRATLAAVLAPAEPVPRAPGTSDDATSGEATRAGPASPARERAPARGRAPAPRWAGGADRVWLDVKPGNVRALALYLGEGFAREQELPASPGRPDGPVALVILARYRDRG